MASWVQDSGVLLKVPLPEASVRALLSPGWAVERTGTVMTLDELPSHFAGMPEGYAMTVADDAGVMFVQVVVPTGELAAKGRFVDVRGLAVHDRIRTEEAHQRRSLRRAVMNPLGIFARERGVREGALVATAAAYCSIAHSAGASARAIPPVNGMVKA